MNVATLAGNPGRPRGRAIRWPLIVVGLLVAHVSLMMTAVVVIKRHDTDRVVPGYYQKGLNWDRSGTASRPAAAAAPADAGVRP
jgi:hypothetical protein